MTQNLFLHTKGLQWANTGTSIPLIYATEAPENKNIPRFLF